MKVEALSVQNALEGPHQDSHESAHGKFSSAHGKFSSAHGNVHESVLGQFSHVLFSHFVSWPIFSGITVTRFNCFRP